MTKKDSTQGATDDVATKAQAIVDSDPKSKRKKAPLFVGIGGLIVLVGLGVLFYFLFFAGVSKADYQEAQEVGSEMVVAYNQTTRAYVSTTASESATESALETLRSGRDTLNEKYDEFKDLKAITRDEEAAKLFDPIEEKKPVLDEYYATTEEIYEKIVPLIRELSSVSSSADVDERIALLKQAQEDIETIDVSQQVNVDYVNELRGVVPEFVAAVEEYAESDDYDSGLYQRISSLSDELTSADDNWQEAYNDLKDRAQMKDDVDALSAYLSEKANQ